MDPRNPTQANKSQSARGKCHSLIHIPPSCFPTSLTVSLWAVGNVQRPGGSFLSHTHPSPSPRAALLLLSVAATTSMMTEQAVCQSGTACFTGIWPKMDYPSIFLLPRRACAAPGQGQTDTFVGDLCHQTIGWVTAASVRSGISSSTSSSSSKIVVSCCAVMCVSGVVTPQE